VVIVKQTSGSGSGAIETTFSTSTTTSQAANPIQFNKTLSIDFIRPAAVVDSGSGGGGGIDGRRAVSNHKVSRDGPAKRFFLSLHFIFFAPVELTVPATLLASNNNLLFFLFFLLSFLVFVVL